MKKENCRILSDSDTSAINRVAYSVYVESVTVELDLIEDTELLIDFKLIPFSCSWLFIDLAELFKSFI